MEVVLESTEGMPEGGVLSIMVGETKRQAPASRLGQPFRFADAPVPVEGESPLPFKVELLVPAAPPQVMVLDPTADHFVVDFGGEMQVMLQQRENPDLHRPVVDVSGAAATHGLPSQKLAMAQRVASYLEEHDLVRTFQDLLNSLLLVKPDDPFGWVEERLVRERLLMNKRRQDDLTLRKNRRQSRGEPAAVRQSMRASVGSLGKVETLLLSLQSCRENLDLIMPLLPPDLQSELNSPDFVAECLHQFQRLDRQGTGRLQPEDLIPILVQISGAKAMSVGRDQCQHLVDMFDIDEDGLVDQDEFVNLTQFVIVASFMESDAGQEVLEAACIEEENFELFLEMVAQDRERLWTIVPFLPYWLKEHVTSAEFQVAASASFRSLDADNSGALEPLELIDVIQTLSEAHPMTIDYDKCRRFIQIFDFHGNGVILRDEFVEFAQFLTVMNYLSTTEGRQVKQMVDASTSRPLASDPMNNHDKLNWCISALERDKANLPSVLHSLPGGLAAELTNEAFTRACLDGFTSLDVDGSGALDPQELFAIVCNLAQVHPFDTDAAQCKRFTAIFDKDTNGLVSKEEFVDLTRFIITMGYLEHALEHEEMYAAELLLGEDRVHQLIDAVRGQADRLPDILPYLPEDLLEEIRSEGFYQRCDNDFALLDKDGSGVLEPRELFPVILNLSEGHHWNLTEDHCHHFVDIFDIQRNGVITIDEYHSFAGFMLIMAFMQTEEGVKVQFDMEVAKSSHEVEDLLQMLERDRGAVHKVIPLLPSDYYNQLTSHDFMMACKRRFLMLDQDKTSVLRPRELIPVVAELAGSFQQAITVEHCERFVDIFDIKRDGVLNLEEFLDFSRFVCIMCYLNTPEGKAVCQDALQVMHDSSTADDLLVALEQEPMKIHQAFAYLPEELKVELLSEHFTVECQEQFEAQDKDGKGSLGAEELYPTIVNFSNSHEASLDVDQCQRFTAVFDTEGKGVVSKERFVEFARFLIVAAWLKSHEGQEFWNAFKAERPSSREKVGSRDLDPSLVPADVVEKAKAGEKMRRSTTTPLWAEPSPSDILNDLMKESAAKSNSPSSKAAKSPAGAQTASPASAQTASPQAAKSPAVAATSPAGAATRSLDLEPEAADDFAGLSNNLAILGLDTPGFDIHEKSEKLSAENDTLRDRLSSLEDLIKSLEGR